MWMPLIEANRIAFNYRGSDQLIIKDLSLDIGTGEFVSIQGPSGSGKSTLLYLLAGFLKPTRGQISVANKNLSKLSELETAQFRNRSLGFIFQQFHLMARKTVLQNILLPEIYPIEIKQETVGLEERARELCLKLGLGDKMDVSPNKLSGGQQQRVAIARALLHHPRVLFADEPTGNLDSKTGAEIFSILHGLTQEGITVVLITHDQALARKTNRQIEMRDGEIISDTRASAKPAPLEVSEVKSKPFHFGIMAMMARLVTVAWGELHRNRSRSVLTLLGILFGVAAVSSMVALGQFTEKNVLKSYQQMGVNGFGVYGWPQWIVDKNAKTAVFQGFQPESDIVPLQRLFPEIQRWTPTYGGNNTVQFIFGGLVMDSGYVWGINESGLELMRRELAFGRNLHPLQVDASRSVCIIGSDVYTQLFPQTMPINQWLTVRNDDRYYSCQITGVLKPSSKGSGGSDQENKSIYVPAGFYTVQASYWWDTILRGFLVEAKPGTNVEKLSKAVINYFKQKYGTSGMFSESTNTVMIAQMRKFLSLFTVLLLFVATLALVVGCIGVSNMMTVSVTERIGEFGLRKALGATNQSLRWQILWESTILCLMAGTAGVATGFIFQQSAIYAASKLFPKLPYSWEFSGWAVFFAMVATFFSGYVSGLSAARKVEELSVAEVLRAE
jgi:macrolide transport system ATP-binding/permease protein